MNALVVFYSRTGTTRKAAQAIAEALRSAGAESVESEEITEPRGRKGLLGFLGAGRDAALKRRTAINPIQADLGSFDLVVIGTPIWAFTCAAPVQTFCRQHGADARAVALFCTMGGSGDKKAFQTMEKLCERAPVATLALIDRHVKQDDQQNFLDRVTQFAQAIVQSGDPPLA